jgi:hypothetical protein
VLLDNLLMLWGTVLMYPAAMITTQHGGVSVQAGVLLSLSDCEDAPFSVMPIFTYDTMPWLCPLLMLFCWGVHTQCSCNPCRAGDAGSFRRQGVLSKQGSAGVYVCCHGGTACTGVVFVCPSGGEFQICVERSPVYVTRPGVLQQQQQQQQPHMEW